MRKILAVLLGCLILSTILSGCVSVKLHPVTDKDVKMQDGWVCMTPEYIQEVMKAKIEGKAK